MGSKKVIFGPEPMTPSNWLKTDKGNQDKTQKTLGNTTTSISQATSQIDHTIN